MIFEQHGEKLKKVFYNKQLWHDNLYISNFFISFTELVVAWGAVVWGLFTFSNTSFLTLHYSIYFGVDWMGSRYNLFVFSGISTFVFFVNFLLANAFYAKRRILSYFLVATASLILFFILIGMGLVLYINWNNLGA